MADTLASLVVALTADIGGFARSMQEAADVTQRQMKSIEGTIKSVGTALVGGLSVATVVSLGKSAIDAADQVHKLSQQTGLLALDVDALSVVAKLNDVEASALVKSYKALATAMNEAGDPSSKQAKMFEALGVSTRDSAGNLRNLKDVTLDIAKVFKEAKDGPEKMAVAVGAFGKAGLEMIPVLNNMAEDMERAAKVQEAFGAISTETAAAGDQFNDSMTLLGEGLKRAFLPVVDSMGPAMDRFSTAMITTGQSGSALSPILSVIFKEILPAAVETVGALIIAANALAKALGNLLGGLAAAMGQIASGNFSGAWQTVKDAFSDSDKIIADSNVAIAGLMDRSAAAAPVMAKTADATNKMAAAAGALGGSTKGAKQSITDYANEILKLQGQMAKLVGTDGGYAHMTAALQQIDKDLRDGKIVTNEAIDAYIAMAKALDELEKEIKQTAEAWESYEKAAKASLDFQKDLDDAQFRVSQTIKAQNDALELEHATLGLTDNARQQFITRLALEKAQLEGNTNAVILLTKQLGLLGQQATDNALLQMADQARQAFEAATAFASDFFVDLFNNGTRSFKNLWESFKQLAFRALADIAAKNLVVSLTGAVGLGGAGAANASSGGLGGALSGIGNLLSGGFGSSGGLLGATGFGGAQTAAIDSALITSGFQSLAGGAITSALGPIVAALPYAGIAAIAIPAIVGLFKKKPKEGGFAESGIDIDRFYGKSQFDSTLAQTTQALSLQYSSIISLLGGTDTAGFAQGFQGRKGKDKEGTTAAFVNDVEVYRSAGVSLGKTQEQIEAALQTEASRALLAALQASELPQYLASIFDSVDVASASSEQIAGLLQTVAVLKQAVTAVQAMGAAFAQLDPAHIVALGEAMGGLDKLASGLAFVNENFATEAAKLEKVQAQMVADFEAIGLAVPATHKAFTDLLNSFDLTTEAGRALYASVLGLSQAFVQVNGTATAAAKAAAELSNATTQVTTSFATSVEAYEKVYGRPFPTAGQTKGQDNAGKLAELLELFSSISSKTTGDYGRELALQIQLVSGAMAQYAKSNPALAGQLRKANREFDASLALFNDLSTRYSDDIAEQLTKLTETYNAQAKQLQGNAHGLDALHQVFEEQWAAIINGTAAGVDGTLDQLARLRQGILDYVDSLKTGELSPLTASQKLSEAQRQYETTLGLASGGDLAALGSITQEADTYLRIARDFFASSAAYTDIFSRVTGDLTTIGTGGQISALDLQAVGERVSASETAKADDDRAEKLAETLVAAIYETAMITAKSGADNAGSIRESVDRSRAALVEAFTVGRK